MNGHRSSEAESVESNSASEDIKRCKKAAIQQVLEQVIKSEDEQVKTIVLDALNIKALLAAEQVVPEGTVLTATDFVDILDALAARNIDVVSFQLQNFYIDKEYMQALRKFNESSVFSYMDITYLGCQFGLGAKVERDAQVTRALLDEQPNEFANHKQLLHKVINGGPESHGAATLLLLKTNAINHASMWFARLSPCECLRSSTSIYGQKRFGIGKRALDSKAPQHAIFQRINTVYITSQNVFGEHAKDIPLGELQTKWREALIELFAKIKNEYTAYHHDAKYHSQTLIDYAKKIVEGMIDLFPHSKDVFRQALTGLNQFKAKNTNEETRDIGAALLEKTHQLLIGEYQPKQGIRASMCR